MSAETPGAKPDLLVPICALIFTIVAVYYLFAPFRIFLKGLLCYWFAIQSYVVLDFTNAKKLSFLAREMLINWKSLLKHYHPDVIEKEMTKLVDQVRIKIFVFNTGIICLFIWYFKLFSREAPSFYGKYDLKKILEEKYNFKIPSPKESVESVYLKLTTFKTKKNLPANLVARLYPPNSKERIYIYKGSYNYEIVPISMKKTLSEVLKEKIEEINKANEIEIKDLP